MNNELGELNKLISHVCRIVLALVILSAMSLSPLRTMAQQPVWPDQQACEQNTVANDIVQGWCLAINPAKGNCIACHTFNISPWPPELATAGNIAPPLAAMQPRFPDRKLLTRQIEDATEFNPLSTMPPYLTHGILNTDEIELIVNFLLSI